MIVTGAARGIGAATAERLSRAGASVVRVDIDEKASDVDVTADVATEAGAERALKHALDRHGDAHIMINNVGGVLDTGSTNFEECTLEQWDAVVALNLRPAFLLPRAALHAGCGLRSIVNVGASLGERSSPHLAAYGAAKAAVSQLTRTMAIELGRKGIRVNCVAPAFTLTPAAAEQTDAKRRLETEWAIPLGRVAVSTEIADVIVFLASDFASFVSGQTVTVDGGLLCTTLRPPKGWDPRP